MLWSVNPPYLAWLAYMAVAYGLFLVARRWTDAGDKLPVTRGNFGKELSFCQTLCGFLRNPTASIFLGLVVAAWTVRLIVGHWSWLDLFWAAATIAVWPFVEWIVHVTMLHAPPRRICGIELDSIFARVHRAHHRHPYHPTFGVAPMFTLVQYFLIVPGFIFLFLRWPRSLTMSAMVATLALRYELWHYFFHRSYKPRSAWFRNLRDRHLCHHFQHEDFWFGVTMTAADAILQTNPDPKTVPRSPTARTLDHREAA